jgi:hypothetical protein
MIRIHIYIHGNNMHCSVNVVNTCGKNINNMVFAYTFGRIQFWQKWFYVSHNNMYAHYCSHRMLVTLYVIRAVYPYADGITWQIRFAGTRTCIRRVRKQIRTGIVGSARVYVCASPESHGGATAGRRIIFSVIRRLQGTHRIDAKGDTRVIYGCRLHVLHYVEQQLFILYDNA